MRKLISLLIILLIIFLIGRQARLLPQFNSNSSLKLPNIAQGPTEKATVYDEESVVTKVVEESLPSVVTIAINKTTQSRDTLQYDPTNPFTPFKRTPGQKKEINQNIGSGFIVSQDGLIITNKHVVADTEATYQVLTNDEKKYDVKKIYRDPLNDLSIIKIDASGLKPLKLGDSDHIKLGQIAIAIGTPLGEFTNSVTTGIISGLGRGITAGSPYEGYVEKLDHIIQTDAAISPGNSGGPLLNSHGDVVGVNTAVASEGQNIGFAIPSNVISTLISDFNKRGGTFERPYLGIRYKMIDQQTAVLNDLVQGAYVIEVVDGSPADKAGIQTEDILVSFDGAKITGDDQTLAKLISLHKVGDQVPVRIWRDGTVKDLNLTLTASP